MGYTIREAAEQLQISKQAVAKAMQRMGIQPEDMRGQAIIISDADFERLKDRQPGNNSHQTDNVITTKQQLTTANQKLNDALQQISSLNADIKSYQDQLQSKDDLIKVLREQIEELKHDKIDLNNQIQRMQINIDDLAKSNALITERYAVLEDKHKQSRWNRFKGFFTRQN